MEGIHTGSIPTKRANSRNGPVLVVEEPVTITYERPTERVLFNAARDANPFLHLYESLWMLAGREDVAPLTYYAKNFLNYSDDGVTLNGAYGYRWRHADTSVEPRDQLEIIIEHLKSKPESRRAVLQMWDVENDLLQIDESKDVCCNLSVMFSLRDKWVDDSDAHAAMAEVMDGPPKVLDMTVTNRSNDLVWGTLGANVVHFSVLQEYMAAHLGVEVGVYNQFTNNLHVYENNWKPEEWLAWEGDADRTLIDYAERSDGVGVSGNNPMRMIPLVSMPYEFDLEVLQFVELHKCGDEEPSVKLFTEPFLVDVASPLLRAFHAWKTRKDAKAAMIWASRVKAEDWRIAAQDWLERRINKKEKVNG